MIEFVIALTGIALVFPLWAIAANLNRIANQLENQRKDLKESV